MTINQEGQEARLLLAEAELRKRIFEALLILKDWEFMGLIEGDGFAVANVIANDVASKLKEYWRPKEKDNA